jgi:DNA-binding GntR family transcriptional regulator
MDFQNDRLRREVKETKADVRRLVQEQADHNRTSNLMVDMLRTTFESEMLQMCEEHNQLVASIKEKDDDVARDFQEADRRLNRHRREINTLHTKVGADHISMYDGD